MVMITLVYEYSISDLLCHKSVSSFPLRVRVLIKDFGTGIYSRYIYSYDYTSTYMDRYGPDKSR